MVGVSNYGALADEYHYIPELVERRNKESVEARMSRAETFKVGRSRYKL